MEHLIKIPIKVYRARIDQPSTLQPFHNLHGTKGIVVDDNSSKNTVRFYLIEGPILSFDILRISIVQIP